MKSSRKIGIKGEYIRLCDLLKFASLVGSGGEAKVLIENGEVLVDGEPCLMRGKKIRENQLVFALGETLEVTCEDKPDPA